MLCKPISRGRILLALCFAAFIAAQSPTVTAEQLQVRCDTLYSAIKPMSEPEAVEFLTTIGKSDLEPLIDDEDYVELRLEIGQGCNWFANKDIKTGKPLPHGQPIKLGQGDSIFAFIDVQGGSQELGLAAGSDFPMRIQNAVALLAFTENEAVAEFSPSWQRVQHEFTAVGKPVSYPQAQERARDYAARFYEAPIILQPGRGKVTKDGQVVLTWEIDGFESTEDWRGNWATLGDFFMANEIARVQCQGYWLGRTSQKPGLSATVSIGPLSRLDLTNLKAGQINQDCVYKWSTPGR